MDTLLFPIRLSQSFLMALILFTPLHSVLSAKSSSSTTLHALIAVDTKSNLTLSVLEDAKKINSLLSVVQTTGTEVKTTVLQDEKLTVDNVQSWLKNLPINSNDVIFFYFSGHGVRTKQTKAPWPILALQHGYQFVEGAQIRDILSKKKARLAVMITDCCNGYFIPKGKFNPAKISINTENFEKQLSDNLLHLFLKTKGTVFITASEPGTNAIGFVSHGGLMTNSFLESIISYSKSDTALDWKTVLSDIKKSCKTYNQTPFYEIKIRSKKKTHLSQ